MPQVAGLSEYEQNRQRQIQENHAKMMEMGLFQCKEHLDATIRASQRPPKPRTHRSTAAAEGLVEPRRSERAQLLPAPQYKVDRAFQGMEGELRKSKAHVPRSAGGPRRRALDGAASSRSCFRNKNGWQVYMGQASDEAAMQAYREGERKVAAIQKKGGKAGIKAMTSSQISGGCWSQLPHEFGMEFDIDKERTVNFLHEGEAYPVKLLRKGKGSTGKSGGWGPFARAQLLFPNDSVVYEKQDDDNLKVHFFRAWDYDTPFKKQHDELVKSGGYKKLAAEEEARWREEQACEATAEAAGEEHGGAGSSGGEEGSEEGGDGPHMRGEGSGRGNDTEKAGGGGAAEGKAGKKASKGAKRKAPALVGGAKDAETGVKRRKGVLGPCKQGRSAGASAGASVKAAAGAAAEGRGKAQGVANGNDKKSKVEGGGTKGKKRKAPLAPVNGTDEFYVEKIVGYKSEGGVDRFLIRWMTYGPEDDTWESQASLSNAPHMYVWDCAMPDKFSSKAAGGQGGKRARKEAVTE